MAGQSDGLYFYLVAVFFVCPSAAASNLVCKVAAQRTLKVPPLFFFSHYLSSCPFPFLLQRPATDCWVSSATDNTSSSLLLTTHHDSIHSLTVAVVIKRPSPALLAACAFSPFSGGATLNLSAWHDPWHWRHSPPLVFWSSGDEDAAADIAS